MKNITQVKINEYEDLYLKEKIMIRVIAISLENL